MEKKKTSKNMKSQIISELFSLSTSFIDLINAMEILSQQFPFSLLSLLVPLSRHFTSVRQIAMFPPLSFVIDNTL